MDRCPVLAPRLEAGLRAFRGEVRPSLVGSGELRLALGAGGGPTVSIDTVDPQAEAAYQALRSAVTRGVYVGASLAVDGAAPATFGDPAPVLESRFGVLRLPPGGFSQANTELNMRLQQVVRSFAVDLEPRGPILELYAGAGNLSVAIADLGPLTLVEQDPALLDLARANLARRGVQRFVCEDAENCAVLDHRWDGVVLDPPRVGAAGAVARFAANRAGPRWLVYVSCNPRSFLRDRRVLEAGGFQVRQATGLDMFPRTTHVELVASFERGVAAGRQIS